MTRVVVNMYLCLEIFVARKIFRITFMTLYFCFVM